MKTVSICVQNLCVPCANRCRYCLLSYDGSLRGIDYERSERYAARFYTWLKDNRPELGFAFYFGYSMEHPQLLDAVDFAGSIGSPAGEFLQFDGLAFRTGEEIKKLLTDIKVHGVRLIDLTFYGDREYHDRFAARQGDFDHMLSILRQANAVGLDVEIGIPLTRENAAQADGLLELFSQYTLSRLLFFIPHGEGRGKNLDGIRLTASDLSALSGPVQQHLNRRRFRPEREWLLEIPKLEKRVLTLSLTPENIDFFESLDFGETVAYLEKLDEDYHARIPDFTVLAQQYGDPSSDALYSSHDLYLHYQRRYISEHNIDIYDINDERQHFSRRF